MSSDKLSMVSNIDCLRSNASLFSIATSSKDTLYKISKGDNVYLVDSDIGGDSFNLLLEEDSCATLSFICKNSLETIINVKLMKNSSFSLYFADFSSKFLNLTINIDLSDVNANCSINLSSIASNDDNKSFEINLSHHASGTIGIVNCYGVVGNNSRIKISGVSHIYNGAIKSSSSQNAKALVFDQNASAIVRPILKIDENDIEASHSAAAGKIADEYLFYLMSRGLNENDAKRLITYGYIKPVLKGFVDTHTQQIIEKLIERKISYD